MRRILGSILIVGVVACADTSAPLAPPDAELSPALSLTAAGGTIASDAIVALSVLGTPVPLTEITNVTINGDYVAAGVGMRDVGAGTINIALPADATVVRAILYWAVMDLVPSATLAQGMLNGSPVTGNLIAATANPCWPTGDIHVYRAAVHDLVVNGGNTLAGFAAAGVPQLFEGASLVVLYTQPGAPQRTIIVKDGAVTFFGPQQNVSLDWSPRVASGAAKTSFIVADGQQPSPPLNNSIFVNGTEIANHVLNGAGPGTLYWDNDNRDISGFVLGASSVQVGIETDSDDGGPMDCLTWVAQVASVVTAVPVPTGTISFSGNINVRSHGSVPIRLLSSAGFDATQVNVSTLAFGPGGAPAGVTHLSDVDGDGDMDLTAHFSVPAAAVPCGATQATITGNYLSGDTFVAVVNITTLGC